MIVWYIRNLYVKKKEKNSNINEIISNDTPPERLSMTTLLLDDEEENDLSQDKVEELNVNSLDRMIFFLTIIETVVAIAWIINVTIFRNASSLQSNCKTCFFFSLYTIFLQVFDWAFFACCLYNLKRVIIMPIEEKTIRKRMTIYCLICILTAAGFTSIVLISGTYGVSPMLTCFMSNGSNNPANNFNSATKLTLYIILVIPLLYIFYILFMFLNLFKLRKLVINPDLKIATFKMLIYSILYILFYFPIFILYLVTVDTHIHSPSVLSWFSYYCSLSGMMMNLVLGLGRLMERFWPYALKDWKCFKVEESPGTAVNQGLAHLNSAKIVDSFIRDIFIGIILKLLHSQDKVAPNDQSAIKSKYLTEESKSTFDSVDQGNNREYFDKLNRLDPTLTDQVYVTVIEHAPKVFKRIRALDEVSEDDIISSLISANIKALTKGKGGKSGALFIPTSDNQFLIKTMEDQDFNSISSESFLTYYYMHFKAYPESMICRFYGIYTILPEVNSSPFRLIVMRNAKGPFKRFIRLSYDLKGSTKNREVKIGDNIRGTVEEFFEVRKDINFQNEVKSLKLVEHEKFIRTVKYDAQFFEDLGIMDYSLFVFQIRYTEKNMESVRNTEIFKYYEKHFYESKALPSDFNVSLKRNTSSLENNEEKIGYIIMIIDYLQKWTLNKRLEKGFKGVLSHEIASSAPPKEYCERFIEYCQRIAN